MATLQEEEISLRQNDGTQAIAREPEFDKTARADFAKVKEILRGYSTLFPNSSMFLRLTSACPCVRAPKPRRGVDCSIADSSS